MLESKKEIKKAGLDDFLIAVLELLKTGHETFTANVLSRSPEDRVDATKSIVLHISFALQDSIVTLEAH
jgi:hypothetical protein